VALLYLIHIQGHVGVPRHVVEGYPVDVPVLVVPVSEIRHLHNKCHSFVVLLTCSINPEEDYLFETGCFKKSLD